MDMVCMIDGAAWVGAWHLHGIVYRHELIHVLYCTFTCTIGSKFQSSMSPPLFLYNISINFFMEVLLQIPEA